MATPLPVGKHAARLVAVFVVAAVHMVDSDSSGEYRMKVLQWNIHGECFRSCAPPHGHAPHCDKNYPTCRMNSTNFLKHWLDTSKPDFAGIEQLEDHEFLDAGMAANRWGHVSTVCGGAKGFGRYPFDIAVLFYNKLKWEPIGAGTETYGGCMEKVWGGPLNNYRAYVVQAFQRKDDSEDRVIVVVAHYSHAEYGLPMLRTAIHALRKHTGVDKLIMLVDSNRERSIPSWNILHQVYPEAKSVVSATPLTTCCYPKFRHSYDRIMAAEFPGAKGGIHTSLPFGFHNSPAWSAFNMHDPIAGSFAYTASKRELLKWV